MMRQDQFSSETRAGKWEETGTSSGSSSFFIFIIAVAVVVFGAIAKDFIQSKKTAEPPKPAPPQVAQLAARNKNAWIILGALMVFIAFAFFVPVRDNPHSGAFKQTLWDMLIGNRGTRIIHR